MLPASLRTTLAVTPLVQELSRAFPALACDFEQRVRSSLRRPGLVMVKRRAGTKELFSYHLST